MQVKELIALLSECNPEDKVLLNRYGPEGEENALVFVSEVETYPCCAAGNGTFRYAHPQQEERYKIPRVIIS